MEIAQGKTAHRALASALIGAASMLGAAGSVSAAPVQWTGVGSNGHYYEYFSAPPGLPATFTGASTFAASSTYLGMQGYLVTITSAAENTFVNALALGQYFMGANDLATPGTIEWIGGPEAGLDFFQRFVGPIGGAFNGFNPGEPNNSGGEPLIIGKFAQGGWNDVPFNYQAGFVIEYGPAATTVVPVPAALPLLASGLALLGFGLRRRKA